MEAYWPPGCIYANWPNYWGYQDRVPLGHGKKHTSLDVVASRIVFLGAKSQEKPEEPRLILVHPTKRAWPGKMLEI